MNTDSKIAAIVPAFNEEATIGKVVGALLDSGLFGEVIVVSDGSSDKTAEIAKAAGARTYELPRNRGKGQAMQHGVTHTDAQIIFFADADLYGFERQHMEAILAPVISGKCAMSVGLRDRGAFLTFASRYMPLIGGERALIRGIFEHIPPEFLKGFMVEMSMNAHCGRHGLKICKVPMPGVTIRRKMQKVGLGKGFLQYIKMFYQVALAAVVVRIGWVKKQF